MTNLILVIDDDPIIRRLTSAILTKEGYVIQAIDSVAGALEWLASQKPDLIICDLILPETSGLEFLAHRQNDPVLQRIPVIVLSASGEQPLINKALSLGASAAVAKPFSQKQLLDAVSTATGSQAKHG